MLIGNEGGTLAAVADAPYYCVNKAWNFRAVSFQVINLEISKIIGGITKLPP